MWVNRSVGGVSDCEVSTRLNAKFINLKDLR